MTIPIILPPYASEVINKCLIVTETRERKSTLYALEVCAEKVVIFLRPETLVIATTQFLVTPYVN